ncbi:MAG: Rieske (2Fe-2S) protein [Chlorobiota bacterium]|jgi:Rieske Fe-S protein|nr:MAG: Rieske (2Fe-2S) protein [Chlorobiota bacterium]
MTRRQLLSLLLNGAWLGGLGAVGWQLIEWTTSHVRWHLRKVRVASLHDVVQQERGIIVQSGQRAVLLRWDGRRVRVLDLRCTHGNCTLRYDAASEQLFCPCHGGAFDRDGNVITGPPTKPLHRVPVRIEGDDVYMLDES